MIHTITALLRPELCYVTHSDVDLDDETQKRFYWLVHCRYPLPIGGFVVNATTAIESKQSAIEAVWKEIGIVTIDRVEPTPF